MPRLPNKKIEEAEKLYKSGMKLTDISKKLCVPEGTIRRWKHDKEWDGQAKKKQSERSVKNNERSEKKKADKANVRKRGAPKGNKNALGNKGNPNPHDVTKHGVYSAVIMDALDEDERELIDLVPTDEEQLLIEEIQLFTIRERKILLAMKKYREQNGEVVVADVTRSEHKRSFKNEEEKADYEKRIKKAIAKGERLPGEGYSILTHTTNKDELIARWEQELSSVQSKKTKAIEALYKLRLERAKLENEAAGNSAVDDWVLSVIEGEENGE